MVKKLNCMVFAVLVIVLGGSVGAAGGPLVISGSTTFQKRILEPAQSAIEKKTGVKLEIRGVGSIMGLSELIQGKADAAMVSAPLDVSFRETGVPKEGTYQEHLILKDIMVPIVNPKNHIRSLSWAQLAAIMSGKIDNWKAVGGRNQRIAVIVPPRSSGTRKYLQEAVMNSADFTDSAFTVVTAREEIDVVARSPLAIGALSKGFVRMMPGKVKVIRTKPIVRQLSIVTKGEPSPELLAVIKFLKSRSAKRYFK